MPDVTTLDFIGTIVAALLTIMVLSFLVGDNPLFRVATSIFIGVAAGYAGVVAWDSVIRPNLISPIAASGLGSLLDLGLAIPLLLVILLMFKLLPRAGRLGSLPMALLVGVGAAVVLGGAITGTLIPQTRAAMLPLALTDTPTDLGASPIEHVANALILVLGTASSLTYFHFSSPRNAYAKVALAPVLAVLRTIGRVFIAVTFGALYAGALMAAIIALAERFHFLGDVVVGLLSSF